ncbi:phosphatidylinositol-4-phosphate 5-kinase-like protein, putative [Trypanosoma cruzi marinkellei]|uniref:Phosphatidylinositol-4-phosphate 5-kinase-like protein, putative n=1 Tax=Trypanosoma cruzi marinkellei TaxID=85056 RepID=K2NFY5_TRYCR|nr:phosphatidylinositol-4-phosphate 5-kinase-like protein, putative [Trypanosoma cruzi marinkellei]
MLDDTETMNILKVTSSEEMTISMDSDKAVGGEDKVELRFPGGSKYIGSMRNGCLSGYGTYFYASTGDKYDGHWKAGMKHGCGTYYYASGDRYVGSWYMGKKHYRGIYTFSNGDEYNGFWKYDKIHGYGVFTIQSNGNRYEGHWKETYRHGHGVFYHGDGDIYDGNWVRGKEEGLGILIKSTGNTYCGEWKNGEMDGKGVLRDQQFLFAVEYAKGHLVSQLPIVEGSKVPEEWSKAYDHYVTFMGKYQRHGGKDAIEKDELRRALEKLKVESAMWQKRYEELRGERSTAKRRSSSVPGDEGKRLLLPNILKVPSVKAKLRPGVATEGATRESSPTCASFKIADDAQATQGMRNVGMKEITPVHPKADLDCVGCNGKQVRHVGMKKGYRARSSRRSETATPKKSSVEMMEKDIELDAEHHAAMAWENDQVQRTIPSNLVNQEETGQQCTEATVLEGEASEEATTFGGCGQQLETTAAERNRYDGNCVPEQHQARRVENLNKRLEEVNRMNAELNLCCDALGRKLNEQRDRYQTLVNQTTTTGDIELLEVLKTDIQRLESQLKNAEEELRTQKTEIDSRGSRCMELESMLLNMARKRTTDPSILHSLSKKMDLARSLQESNAELARLLEESNMKLEIIMSENKNAEEQRHSAEDSASALGEELRRVRKELRKEQHKSKKILADRESMVAELHDANIKLVGAECAIKALQGYLTITIRVQGCREGYSVPCIRINEGDSSQIVLGEESTTQIYQFDICIDEETSLDVMFREVCRNILTVTMGFHVAYVTLGAVYTGKTVIFDTFVPLAINTLCNHSYRYPVDKYALTYKVGALAIGACGAIDCETGSTVTDIRRDAHGFTVPIGVTFVETTGADILSTVERLRKRQPRDLRCHIWIQIQCVILHRVRQTSTVGRLTLVDLCGPGPLPTKKEDVASARFANRSFGHIVAVLESLQDSQGVAQYNKSLETALLSDVFGGNALTTIFGTLSSAAESVSESRQTLRALTMASKVVNRPILPRFVSSDELRWREVVAATSSAEVASSCLLEVDELRDM